MNLYQKWCLKKAEVKLNRLSKFYNKENKILEVGSGNCALSFLLRKSEFDISPMDIKNKSAFRGRINPLIYNGVNFPFKDDEFDIVQFITVLHHIPFKTQLKVLEEAKRVGKKVIVMEDIYDSNIQKNITFIADSINNNEYFGHPHSNRDDDGWRRVFKEKELKIEHSEYYDFLLFFKQATYILT